MKAFQEMVERARAEGRERKAMRAEDRYTEETDPVDTQERRMKRQTEAWKEEHKDELRDDQKEWAQRCLQNERGGGHGGDGQPGEETEDAQVIEEEEEEKPAPARG